MERTTQKLIPVPGGQITVDIYGQEDKPAIVIIPGVMADAEAWSTVAQHLDRWPTVAVVNRRGRHPSSAIPSFYGLASEVEDALAVLRSFSDVRTLFGWSFGALIALHAANQIEVPHLIGYEPIMAPFGAAALPNLQRAHEAGDFDASVEIALRQVTGAPAEVVEGLRAMTPVWNDLQRLSVPIHAETKAINDAGVPAEFATRAGRVDLIIGEFNQGKAPYGTTFEDASRRLPEAATHVLTAQGHLGHLEAPERLASLVNSID